MYLGIFESIVHIVGIKLHEMKKPYTPGLVTAILLLCMSIFSLIRFVQQGVAQGLDYLLGLILMIICFAVMQRTVIAIFGLGYKDIIAKVRQKFN